jgi:hypothetical protein
MRVKANRGQERDRFLQHRHVYHAPIVDATKSHHLQDAIAALSLRLSPEEIVSLEEPYTEVELAKQVVGCGNTSGNRVDKFQTFGLTPVAASQVKAPLIKECYPTSSTGSSTRDWLPPWALP